MTVDEILAAQDEIMTGALERELTDDEVQRYEELEADLVGARRRDGILQRHAATRAAATPPIRTGTRPADEDQRSTDDPEAQRRAVQDAPEFRQAWSNYLRGTPGADRLLEQRAQSTLIGSEGGYTVPIRFRNRIVERMVAFGGLANVVESFTTGDGAPVRWATIDDTANLGAIVAENQAPASGADLVFGEANLGAYKYMAVGAGGLPLRLSVELVQDAGFDIESKVAGWLGMRMARAFAVDIVKGSGVGEPQGIVTGRTGIQTAANNALTYADLLTYVHSVDPAYRQNARWAFNDSFLKSVRGLVDLNGRPLLVDANNGIEGNPGGARLLDYPVTIDQAFDNFTNNSPTVNFGVFGDLQEGYVVRRVRDVVLVVDPYTRALNGQVQFTAWMRADGVQQNTNAYVALTGKS